MSMFDKEKLKKYLISDESIQEIIKKSGNLPKKKLSNSSRLIMHGGNIADAVTTMSRGENTREANPLLGEDPSMGKVMLMKGLLSAGQDFMLSRLAKSKPGLANGIAKGLGMLNFGVSGSNIYQTRKSKR